MRRGLSLGLRILLAALTVGFSGLFLGRISASGDERADITQATERFFTLLAGQDFESVTDDLYHAGAFGESPDLQRLYQRLKLDGIDPQKPFDWLEPVTITDHAYLLTGVIHYGDQDSKTVKVVLVNDGGRWKIYSLFGDFYRLPDQPRLADQAAAGLRLLMQARNSNNPALFLDSLSLMWRTQLEQSLYGAADALNTLFRSLKALNGTLDSVVTSEPVIVSILPREEGTWEISGYFKTYPAMMHFRQKYVHEGLDLRLLGLSLAITCPEPCRLPAPEVRTPSPRTIVLLVDNAARREDATPEVLQAMRQALQQVVREQNEGLRFGVLIYDAQIPDVVQGGSSELEAYIGRTLTLTGQATHTVDALEAAIGFIRDQAQPVGRNAIIVVTDNWQDRQDGRRQTLRRLSDLSKNLIPAANGSHTKIHVITAAPTMYQTSFRLDIDLWNHAIRASEDTGGTFLIAYDLGNVVKQLALLKAHVIDTPPDIAPPPPPEFFRDWRKWVEDTPLHQEALGRYAFDFAQPAPAAVWPGLWAGLAGLSFLALLALLIPGRKKAPAVNRTVDPNATVLLEPIDNETSMPHTITGQSITIGRDAGNSLVINDPGISLHHARIDFDSHVYTIRDLGSVNQTLVNGRAVDPEHGQVLVGGDEIRIHNHRYEFRVRSF